MTTTTYSPQELSESGKIPLHPQTILNLIRSGELKAINIARGKRKMYRVSQQAVDEWLKSRQV